MNGKEFLESIGWVWVDEHWVKTKEDGTVVKAGSSEWIEDIKLLQKALKSE